MMVRKGILKNICYPLLFICLSVSGSGCGYTTGSLLPERLKTIYVDNFKNAIEIGKEVTESLRYSLYRPGLENSITTAVVDRFVFDGNLKITGKEKADLMLKGELIDYRKEALRYNNNDDVEEYRVKISINMELVDTVENKVLWGEKSFVGESTYNTTGRFATTEDVAREKAIEDLARRIVERTVEEW